MRITTVSAHFPPNFVSGATLITERIARRLQSRGHEVRVFSGWTGPDRPVASTWLEDADGLPVQWIVTTPWTAWKNPKNYDNHIVAELFAEYLDRSPTDLVHFHSLQSLGVGLVHAAVERRIPTVVTMHDFWWWCSRQFLCDRRYEPCSLVVEAGTCTCEAGRERLDLRAKTMQSALAKVDRIIAVSDISARVLIANGTDSRRVVVVENGIPPSDISRRREEAQLPVVRFLYAGGPDRMKGPHILAEAARMLRDQAGWSLDCYGCEVWRNRLASPSVRIHPPFAPDELDSVLAAADVLVLPSVARESYSILAREALVRGVPVISSDCLGPQEVVRHGSNGLIVPSADPTALSRAMRDVVEQPEILARLRSGCHARPMPETEVQVDRLEHTYVELTSGRRDGRGSECKLPLERVLFVVGIDGAPLRYRAWLPSEGLRSLGVHADVMHYRHPAVPGLATQADALVLYRVPATVQILELIANLRDLGIPVIFDVDDLIFVPGLADRSAAVGSLPPEEMDLWLDGVRRYRTTMEHCDAFFGSTPMLVHYAEEAGLPGFVLPNGVGKLVARASDQALHRARRRGPLRIGYLSGTNTHHADWLMVEPAIAKVLDAVPEVELWLVGLVEPTNLLAKYRQRIVRRNLVPWWKLPGVLRDLDINLAPLVLEDPFNECKSAIKWLEAALVSTPTVASPTGPFREVIRSGDNGVLAANEEEWVDAIRTLMDFPDRRARIGAEARRDALLNFAPSVQAHRYLRMLDQVRSRAVATSGHDYRAPDEPPRTVRLEPYALPNGGVIGQSRAAIDQHLRESESLNRFVDLARLSRQTLADDGLEALVRRSLGMARRILTKRRPGT